MKERERLEKLIEAEHLTAKDFAREVGIQAGTISNIMSGRNNPSLDVLQRVLNRYRAISADWLILGIGSMYRQPGEKIDLTLFDLKPEPEPVLPAAEPVTKVPASTVAPVSETTQPVACKQIDKIVVFYTDGTYEER